MYISKPISSIKINWKQSIEQMRKQYLRQPPAPFLPTVLQNSSRKRLGSISRRGSKENGNVEAVNEPVFKMEPAHQSLAKRKSFKTPSSPFEELLSKKLLGKERPDVPTKPKTNQPWIAQEMDMNNLATRVEKMESVQTDIQPSQHTEFLRRNSCHGSLPSSQQNPLKATKNNTTAKLPRQAGCGAISLREKVYSCKIAMKKGIFPMNKKKSQQQKMEQFFQQSGGLSTIQHQQPSEGEDNFVQLSSFLDVEL